MQHHEIDMTPARRGRPPTGIRKERVQVLLEVDDHATLVSAVEVMGGTQAELCRALIKGEVTWAEVERAAKKARK